MATIPEDMRRDVITELYRRLDDMRWEELTMPERSAAYQRMVEEPLIGARLALHLPADRIRVWIKDGPAKEYRRALEGVGPYAEFTQRRTVGAEGVVSAVLGDGWEAVPDSVGEKPMRCVAQRDTTRRLVVWGPEAALKELFWHAAVHVAESQAGGRPLMVVTRRGNAPIDATTWRRAQRLGDLLGCDVAQVSLAVTWKSEDD